MSLDKRRKPLGSQSMLRCSKCESYLPASDFHKDRTNPRGYHGHCRRCVMMTKKIYGPRRNLIRRIRYATDEEYRLAMIESAKQWASKNQDSRRQSRLKRDFGIGIAEYDKMQKAQHGVCAICKEPPVLGTYLSVDHDHKTGNIRGLLCSSCNCGIGHLQDSIANLQRAILYLKGEISWPS